MRDLEREREDPDDESEYEPEVESESDPESESELDSEPEEDALREPNKSREYPVCHVRRQGGLTSSASFLTWRSWTILPAFPSRALSLWLRAAYWPSLS